MTANTAAAILAAGRGSRYLGDTPKPLALLAGRPLVAWAVDAARTAAIGPVIVVSGHAGDDVARATGDDDVVVVKNIEWQSGIASSLRVAVQWAQEHTIDALLIGLADQPGLSAEAWQTVAAADPAAAIVAATYDGRRAHPIRIARSLFTEAAALTGDEGARQLMRRHRVFEVATAGNPVDIDTIEDLQRFEAAQPGL